MCIRKKISKAFIWSKEEKKEYYCGKLYLFLFYLKTDSKAEFSAFIYKKNIFCKIIKLFNVTVDQCKCILDKKLFISFFPFFVALLNSSVVHHRSDNSSHSTNVWPLENCPSMLRLNFAQFIYCLILETNKLLLMKCFAWKGE